MSQSFAFYDPATGELADLVWSGHPIDLQVNTPPGLHPVAGPVDPAAQRVRLVTDDQGAQVPVLIDWQPPAPADDELRTWAWDTAARRWLPQPTLAAREADARAQRDRRLAACDWVVARATERAEPVPAGWATYRQALRDVTAQAGWPDAITWPAPPA